MMLTALFLVWLQMSAQTQTNICDPMTCLLTASSVGTSAGDYVLTENCTPGQQVKIQRGDKAEPLAICQKDGKWASSEGRVTVSAEELKVEAQRAADETDGKPHRISYEPYGIEHPAEPVDVPAVQEPSREPRNCSSDVKANRKTAAIVDGWVDPLGLACFPTPPIVWTCKDKSRILEHDENSPPKYWCRKVQP